MGCCFSRPEGPNSPYPGGAPSSSARAIIIPAAIPPPALRSVTTGSPKRNGNSSTSTAFNLRTDSTSFPRSQQRRLGNTQRDPRPTLAQHINKPLRRRRWTSRNRVWTRRSIDRERTEFFDTRVTGRSEIWQTLRAALEILWEADLETITQQQGTGFETTANDGSAQGGRDAEPAATVATTPSAAASSADTLGTVEALATAQTMLNAAGITLPTSDLAQGAYDAFGNFYALPAWIVSDPTNLSHDSKHDQEDSRSNLGQDDEYGDEGEEGEDYLSDEHTRTEDDGADGGNARDSSDSSRKKQQQGRPPSLQRRRVEKGKAVAVPTDQIIVRARLSATSRDVVVQLGREETVRSLVHRILEEGKLPHKTRIRIAYLGKILKDNSPLMTQGWTEGHVVNALVFDR